MSWTEDDSAHFIDEGKYFVPERAAQIATNCAAIPPLAGAGHIVELCSGEGLLTRARPLRILWKPKAGSSDTELVDPVHHCVIGLAGSGRRPT